MMPTMISMVTYNRQNVLDRVLDAIEETCRGEDVVLHVTDNGSSDGTGDYLREWASRPYHASVTAGERITIIERRAYHLKGNLGTDIGRNASHWAECIGHDTVRMDDKVLPLVPGWLTALKVQAERHHAVVGAPYDPTVLPLCNIAPPVEYVDWPHEQGMGGPLLYFPADVTQALGACDELFPEHKYGWTDCLYIERAKLLGWRFGWALHVPVTFLAQASPERRAKAQETHGLFTERLRQYREAERDVTIPIEGTLGWQYREGVRT